jgi:hypothetical protein
VLLGPRLGLTTRSGWQWRICRGREEGALEETQGGDGRGKDKEACVFPKNMHGMIKKTWVLLPLLIYLTRGGASTLGNPGFPVHTTPTNPNFQQPYYQSMSYGPIPNIFFPRTPAYATPNPRVESQINDGVRNQIARTLREFGFTPKGQARS